MKTRYGTKDPNSPFTSKSKIIIGEIQKTITASSFEILEHDPAYDHYICDPSSPECNTRHVKLLNIISSTHEAANTTAKVERTEKYLSQRFDHGQNHLAFTDAMTNGLTNLIHDYGDPATGQIDGCKLGVAFLLRSYKSRPDLDLVTFEAEKYIVANPKFTPKQLMDQVQKFILNNPAKFSVKAEITPPKVLPLGFLAGIDTPAPPPITRQALPQSDWCTNCPSNKSKRQFHKTIDCHSLPGGRNQKYGTSIAMSAQIKDATISPADFQAALAKERQRYDELINEYIISNHNFSSY